MSHEKSKKDILDKDQSLNKAMDEYWESYMDWWYDHYDYDDMDCHCGCCPQCSDYTYKDGENRDGRMVDLDNISIERRRNVRIGRILGEETDGKTTIGDIINAKQNRDI